MLIEWASLLELCITRRKWAGIVFSIWSHTTDTILMIYSDMSSHLFQSPRAVVTTEVTEVVVWSFVIWELPKLEIPVWVCDLWYTNSLDSIVFELDGTSLALFFDDIFGVTLARALDASNACWAEPWMDFPTMVGIKIELLFVSLSLLAGFSSLITDFKSIFKKNILQYCN